MVLGTHDGMSRIYVNGVLENSSGAGGDFANWDTGCPLTVGNEPSGDRPWLGELYLLAVFDRSLTGNEIVQNFVAGPSSTFGEGDLPQVSGVERTDRASPPPE